ncbi:hypothetical protein LZ30DRAFT_784758 [Colletotrichum cereale]|nr:hypothetical protein LZ30DRAFT_784758 [Colletotrichum cereale]
MSGYNFRSRPASHNDLPFLTAVFLRNALQKHPEVPFLFHPSNPIDAEVSEPSEKINPLLGNKADEAIVLSSESMFEVDNEYKGLPIEPALRDALNCFEPGTWLNDLSIWRVMTKLVARDGDYGVIDPLVVEVVSNQAGSLSGPSWNVDSLARDWFNKRHVLMVVNPLGLHWVLFLWEMESKQIYMYDSLSGGSYEAAAIDTVVKFVKVAFPNEEVAAPIPRECSQQPNGFDCGLHVLRNADLLTSTLLPGATQPPLDPQEMRFYYRQAFLGITP